MKRILRWAAYALASLVLLGLAFAGWVWGVSQYRYARTFAAAPEPVPVLTAAQRAEGPRLARVLGCFDCHGDGLRGRLFFDEPGVAKVWAPNLTLVAAEASDEQLLRAIRQGVGRDGRALWIMPSGQFARLPRWQAAAVVAAVRQVPRGGVVQPRIALGPMGRLGIALGKFNSSPEQVQTFRSREPYYAGRDHEQGRRIAGSVCSDCHGPDLGGGQPGFDKAPPDLVVAAGYEREDFRRLLRTGRPPDGRDLGLMRVMAEKGLAFLRDDEIDAVHAYLKARADGLQK